MRLTTAMLADAADVNLQTGKLFVHGGSWSRLFAPTFPVTHPTMALVLVIEVSYDEALADHTVTVVLERDGEPVGARADGVMQTGHPPGQARGAPSAVPMALTFPLLTFAEPGRFDWRILFDDVPVDSIPMEVAPIPAPRAKPRPA